MKAMIAMSGGVDSSVAAKLMIDRGYQCIGCTMRLYNNEDVGAEEESTCCSLSDVEDARSVAYKLGMKYYVFNYTKEFRTEVIDRFISCYEAGCTPNPCIDCNRYLKFGKLYEQAKTLGCDCIVTGHYARVEQSEAGGYVLKKALDPSKDQSYVLYNLTQEQLAHTIFPLGEISKNETRAIADECGFINADKPDSQDICFVPNGDYGAVIEQLTGKKCPAGNYIDKEGKVIGTHKGIINYTIGQRKGLGQGFGKHMYVLKIEPKDNTVMLGDNEDLFKTTLTAKCFNWISGEAPVEPLVCKAKIRYNHKEQPATATVLSDGRVQIVFDEPQRAITPGQTAVLYDGDIVLGGGIIE